MFNIIVILFLLYSTKYIQTFFDKYFKFLKKPYSKTR